MNKKRTTRRFWLISSILLTLAGVGMVLLGSYKTVQIVVDGIPRNTMTFASRVIDILRQAKVEYDITDRVRPGLNERVGYGGRISINHAVDIHLDPGNGVPPFSFTTYQRFGGNILLDAGLRLYPGDRLMWKGTELRPDFNLAGVRELDLKLEQAETFTLVTESDPDGKIAHGSGATVFDALLSAGISVSKSMIVIPDGEAPFESGMTIEVLPVRELLVSKNGTLTPLISSGATVGEALARAGMPLMGSDISIPAAGEPLPADGRILVVPVRDAFTLHAESIRRETDWTANRDLSLDETKLISEGKNGLRGTFSRERIENGEVVLNETSEEMVLVQPVNEKREYGTKINIQTVDTPEGPLEYYRAVKVYATSYSPCRSGTGSCINGTSSGMKVQKGVVAVTSSWYNQFGGQSVYVPDYGKAVIGDVGGGIPGRYWIDLAYEDENFEGWSKETTLYFLTPVPANMVWVLQ
ncbi:MAG: DUF348 domain-containing protein [Anaerolineaceae bacterium]|nr:DUF348 domain-containing protein [Anaerolineaceae bacterium]